LPGSSEAFRTKRGIYPQGTAVGWTSEALLVASHKPAERDATINWLDGIDTGLSGIARGPTVWKVGAIDNAATFTFYGRLTGPSHFSAETLREDGPLARAGKKIEKNRKKRVQDDTAVWRDSGETECSMSKSVRDDPPDRGRTGGGFASNSSSRHAKSAGVGRFANRKKKALQGREAETSRPHLGTTGLPAGRSFVFRGGLHCNARDSLHSRKEDSVTFRWQRHRKKRAGEAFEAQRELSCSRRDFGNT